MKHKKLTVEKEQKVVLIGNCIFSEARLFPTKQKNPFLIRVPLSVLKDNQISLAEAKNLIESINEFVGTNKSFIVYLNGTIFQYERDVGTMALTESFSTLEGISINDEKENLILWVFGLTDLERKFRKTFLDISKLESNFDEKLSLITFGNIKIKLPPSKNEFNLCRVMFDYKVNEPIDWSIVWNKIEGNDDFPESFMKDRLHDTIDRINKKVKKALGLKKNLFSWKHKNISRNF